MNIYKVIYRIALPQHCMRSVLQKSTWLYNMRSTDKEYLFMEHVFVTSYLFVKIVGLRTCLQDLQHLRFRMFLLSGEVVYLPKKKYYSIKKMSCIAIKRLLASLVIT